MKTAKPTSSGEVELLPATREPAAVTTLPPGQAVMEISMSAMDRLIDKAVDSKAAVEIIEKLRAMRNEDRQEQAKAQFDEAMSAFQSECPVVQKEKIVKTNNGQKAYTYAPIEAIEIQIRPVLRKFGFSHTFDTDTASQPGWVVAKCIVTHRAGHARTSTVKFPLGGKTQVMSDTQVYAAALTFANRRALCNAYGLVLAGEDMDGQTGKLKPDGPSALRPSVDGTKALVEELWNVLKPVRGAAQNWNESNQWLWRMEITDGAIPETVPNLSEKRLREIIEAVRKKINNP